MSADKQTTNAKEVKTWSKGRQHQIETGSWTDYVWRREDQVSDVKLWPFSYELQNILLAGSY